MFSFKGKGFGYVILNVIRFINFIVLGLIAASSFLLMFVAKMPNAFTFFNDVSLAFIMGVCFLLCASEACQLNWINNNWPAIGSERGFTWLGFAMIILGSHTLGQLSDDRNSVANMGLPFWRASLAAGVLAIFFGFVNIMMSWWYGSKNGANARRVRRDGESADNIAWPDKDFSSHTSSIRKEKGRSVFAKFGRGKPKISQPIPHDSEQGFGERPIEDRGSPVMPGIQRPPTLAHPVFRPTSEYSEASNVNRF
ncbi:hypothetical protein BJ170DRAFT_54270 [Xylariales sp. AK1849]|nr:hypothetical protein BJ170DRAFT_54270 [Xylariales sp. AK1849]